MYYTREYLNRAHREIDTIFRVLFPEHGMAVREEQIMLCHKMLDNLLGRNIALCDAGVGIGKTYAYLVACVLMRKYSLLAEGCSPYEQRPVVISTSSIALQKAILTEYIPFLSRILQENGTIQSPIKAVIRKGKEHFVCDERLAQRIVAIEGKNKNALQKEALLSLKEHYDMDEVSNLSGFDRRMVSVPKFCSGDCPKRGSCRYQQYLERSRDHEMFIQICNHNYLLADGYHRLQDYRPLLKDYRALIVDEAHKLPDAAKQMFGKSLCYDDIREICFYLGKEYQGPEIRKLSGTIRMVLDIIGENHRTRYGIKEEFHMTEECAMYLCEGIQTMNKIIEKLEKKRLNAEITQMDVQIARCLLIHQMLGTRISDTLTLRPDCLTRENGQDMIEIYQVKTKRYKKPISKELAKLLQSSIEYTQEKFGDTEYIFVNEKEPDRPMQYMAIKTKVMSMIQEKQLKDDHGELFGFGTHMFRHYYGVKLTEMHLDDWTIARLLGHKRLNNVQHYRKMSNQRMADETREVRQRMSDIIYMSLAGWGEEYEQIRQDD